MIEQLNSMAQAWWDWMGPMFWQIGVLVLVVGTVDFLLRRHLWPQLRYALWLLILVKLMTPPTFSLSTGIVSQLRAHVDQRASEIDTADTSAGPPAHGSGREMGVQTTGIETLPVPVLDDMSAGRISDRAISGNPTGPDARAKLSWQAYSMVVWLMGVGALGGWLIVRLRRGQA